MDGERRTSCACVYALCVETKGGGGGVPEFFIFLCVRARACACELPIEVEALDPPAVNGHDDVVDHQLAAAHTHTHTLFLPLSLCGREESGGVEGGEGWRQGDRKRRKREGCVCG